MKNRFVLTCSQSYPVHPLFRSLKRIMVLTAFFGACLAFSGCSSMQVAAWEKGNLAKPVMVRDTNAHHAGLEQHTYMSKEATEGGYSLGAGGCGCN